jgi:Tol biopolymer transport system component
LARRLALLTVVSLAALGWTSIAQAAFPGSPGAIAFNRSTDPSDKVHLFVLPPGGTAFAFTTDPGSNPAWSPDGRRLALTRSGATSEDLWVMNADGTGGVQITHLDGSSGSPSWSPDGTRIAFVHANDGNDGIQIVAADGTGTPMRIPGTGDGDTQPAWSPDGTRIAVRHFNNSTAVGEIWLVDVSGANLHPLSIPPDSTVNDGDPAWSPDGATVYFSRTGVTGGCTATGQIRTVPAGGGLSNPISPDPNQNDSQPTSSPDGSQVAFVRCDTRDTNSKRHLWVMSAFGGPATQLTSGASVDDSDPDWQPSAPRFSSAPSISGSAVNNQTLTATAGDSPGGGTTVLQFVRCAANGSACVPIPGASVSRARAAASNATYKLTSADLGHAVRVRQIQTNSLGSTSADSAPTRAVVPSPGRCSNRFTGTSRSDRIHGSTGSARISGGRGKDRLFGLAGSDCISGGAGNDTINAGGGRNTVSGGTGNDIIDVRNDKRDRVSCGKGRDRIRADRTDKLRGCERIRRFRR